MMHEINIGEKFKFLLRKLILLGKEPEVLRLSGEMMPGLLQYGFVLGTNCSYADFAPVPQFISTEIAFCVSNVIRHAAIIPCSLIVHGVIVSPGVDAPGNGSQQLAFPHTH